MSCWHDALSEIFDSYDLNFVWTQRLTEEEKFFRSYGRRWSWGPRDCAIVWPRTVILFGGMLEPEDVLHEAVHLIVAKSFNDIQARDEGDGLMQLEWALAKEHFTRSEQKAVEKYQRDTTLAYHSTSGAYRRSKWWHAGFQMAVEMGLLYENGIPTYRRRKWAR